MYYITMMILGGLWRIYSVRVIIIELHIFSGLWIPLVIITELLVYIFGLFLIVVTRDDQERQLF